MDVEYDEAKRQLTLRERGLDFARAAEIFETLDFFTQVDDRRDYGELRFQTMGELDGVLIMLIWTPRGGALRVISLRRCNDDEKAFFQERVGRSR